jgi:hypothetical protein
MTCYGPNLNASGLCCVTPKSDLISLDLKRKYNLKHEEFKRQDFNNLRQKGMRQHEKC